MSIFSEKFVPNNIVYIYMFGFLRGGSGIINVLNFIFLGPYPLPKLGSPVLDVFAKIAKSVFVRYLNWNAMWVLFPWMLFCATVVT